MRGRISPPLTNQRPVLAPADCNEVAGDRFRGTRSLSHIIRQPRSSAQQFYSRLRINKSLPGVSWVTLSSADCLIAASCIPSPDLYFSWILNKLMPSIVSDGHEPLIRIKDWFRVRLQIRCRVSVTWCYIMSVSPRDNQEEPIMEYSEQN